MERCTISQMMDDFYHIVNTTPVEDSPTKILRHAGTGEHVIAIEALVRLLVIENARRRHAEAKLLTLKAVS